MSLRLTIAAAALAAIAAEYVRMEAGVNTFSAPRWLKEQLPSEDDLMTAVFVLKYDKSQIESFDKELLSLATPSSSSYGKWLSAEQVKERVAPSAENLKTVTDFIASFGVMEENVRVSKFGDMVHVKMPIKTASEMLRTKFALFRSLQQRDIALPRVTQPYYLPEEVASVVSIVGDILRLPALRDSPRSFGVGSSFGSDPEFDSCGSKCSGYTTPDVLQAAYGYPDVKTVSKGNSVSVAEFQYQYYDQADLDAFDSACDTTVTVDDVVGGNKEKICELGGCVEALLDIEYIGAITNPIPLTVIYSSTFSLLDWVDGVISMDEPPLVHSVSYGNDEVQQTSVEYMESVNTQFMKAGAMGLSILFASGDQGVWGRSGVGSSFNPDFPAASPYVTSVGGTNFATKSKIGEESAWSCGGGGFSDTFAMPDWQADVVSAYLTTAAAEGVLPASALFNSSGRAYPDVAALGGQTNPYCVSTSGGSKFGGVAGTSASCPVVAGVFAQLNNVRLANGKSPMGWLNPFIYSNPSCFNDVSDGSQNNCNAGTTGFAALAGWDPATGFGSPNYACLEKAI